VWKTKNPFKEMGNDATQAIRDVENLLKQVVGFGFVYDCRQGDAVIVLAADMFTQCVL
jgi:hypothetical protein